MKLFFIALLFVFTSSLAYAQPVAGLDPTLVPEDVFAVRLASAFGIASTDNAGAAESALAGKGIAPDDGWISNYPVTPVVVSELWENIKTAAANGRLPAEDGKDTGFATFKSVLSEFGLNFAVTATGSVRPPPPVNQEDIDDYYNNASDPPVSTYYTPPPAYIDQYMWIGFPFFYAGYWWPGYWVMRDFHRHYFYHGRHLIMSNHWHGHGIFNPGHRYNDPRIGMPPPRVIQHGNVQQHGGFGGHGGHGHR